MEEDNLQLGPREIVILLRAAGGRELALGGPGDGGKGGEAAARMRRGSVRARNCSRSAPPRVKARTAITPHCRKMILSTCTWCSWRWRGRMGSEWWF
jgi:hypothetical protein